MAVKSILRPLGLQWQEWRPWSERKYARLRAGTDNAGLPELQEVDESRSCVNLKDGIVGWLLAIYVVLSTCGLIFYITRCTTVYHSSPPQHAQQQIMASPCGNSTNEARAAGCQFDIISFSWLPAACYDAQLAEDFRALKGWEYWLDRNKTQPLSQERALTGEFPGLYTEFEYHLRHCTFLWKKMHRAVLGQGKAAIDSVTGAYAHTEHCAHMLMTRREVSLDVINAVIMVKYPDCGIL